MFFFVFDAINLDQFLEYAQRKSYIHYIALAETREESVMI